MHAKLYTTSLDSFPLQEISTIEALMGRYSFASIIN